MKRFVPFLIFVTIFSLLFPVFASAADDVELIISPDDITINTTETDSVDIIITNNQGVDDTFYISIWPSTTWYGVTPDLGKSNVKIAAGSNSTTKLYFSVSSRAEGPSTFLITVKSKTSKNVSVSSDVTVRVQRKTLVYISDLAVDKSALKPDECINITPSVTNDDIFDSTEYYKLQTTIKRGTDIIQRFEDDIFQLGKKSIKTIPKSYCFGKYAEPGRYSVEVELKTDLNKFMDSMKVDVKVDEVPNLIVKKSGIYTPFIQMETIDIKNEGNMIETNFNVVETVPEFTARFFYPIDTPTSVKSEGGMVVYSWMVERLAPGEEIQVKYEIRYISLWVGGIALVILVFFAFSHAYRPKIKKNVRFLPPLKKGRELIVLLEVKNATIHEIKNIVVNDSVSGIVSLIEKFDTMSPIIKKSEAGTTLTWRIKSLKPLEERVLTYRIKPKVDVIGSMRLPRSTMTYMNNKNEKKVVASRSVEIK